MSRKLALLLFVVALGSIIFFSASMWKLFETQPLLACVFSGVIGGLVGYITVMCAVEVNFTSQQKDKTHEEPVALKPATYNVALRERALQQYCDKRALKLWEIHTKNARLNRIDVSDLVLTYQVVVLEFFDDLDPYLAETLQQKKLKELLAYTQGKPWSYERFCEAVTQ